MILLQSKFESLPPKIISYKPTNSLTKKNLNELEISKLSVDVFKMIFLNVLNSFAPVRKIYLRANHSKFVNKELSKAMIQRTKLRNKFLKEKTTETRLANKKQRNICCFP